MYKIKRNEMKQCFTGFQYLMFHTFGWGEENQQQYIPFKKAPQTIYAQSGKKKKHIK